MTSTTKKVRDPRLDFFRGLGMFIIFVAHTPMNPLTKWIPARFGFSDATEIFVFCSGMASAIAFGAVFDRHGWLIGAARVAHRVWQVYWAQIVVFFVIAGLVAYLDSLAFAERSFVDGLNLARFFEDPATNLLGLLTLTYVPNYFDILPMYIVILAMMPLVMALAHFSPRAAIVGCLLLWAAVSQPWIAVLDVPVFQGLNLPAEPWSERTWFFNPFAWQLIFFTGFAFMRGWIPAPPVRRELVWLSIAVVIAAFFLHHRFVLDNVPALQEARNAIAALTTKTYFGLFRFVHFLALAYLAFVAAGVAGRNLPSTGWKGQGVEIVKMVGQQSLAVFLTGLVIARLAGVAFVIGGTGPLMVLLVNAAGFAILILVARMTAWFKSQPWKRRPETANALSASPRRPSDMTAPSVQVAVSS